MTGFVVQGHILYYIIFSAVKRLITINRIKNKSFCLHNICMCTVYIYYVYKYKHMHVYIHEKYVMFILNIFIYNIKYKNINVCM